MRTKASPLCVACAFGNQPFLAVQRDQGQRWKDLAEIGPIAVFVCRTLQGEIDSLKR